MSNNDFFNQTVKKILDIARYAPSVHNIQPWKIKLLDNSLIVSVDTNHSLEAGDPVKRQTVLSLGIFTEAIFIAAEALGLKVQSINLDTDQVTVALDQQQQKPKQEAVENVELIKKRFTNRSIYTPITLNDEIKKVIADSWQSSRINIWVVEDKKFIQKVAELTSKGIALALSNPDFRSELSKCLVLPWSHKKRGISVKSLYLPGLLAVLQPALLNLGISTKKESELEKKRWLSASGIVLITSEGDLYADWFESGRAYLRTSLAIEQAGLSQATSAATVEASNFHEDIEEMLGTKQRLQAVIRIGASNSRPQYSPRVNVEDIFTLN